MDLLFGRGKPVVAPVPSDRVVPLHFFEDSLLVQGNNMAVSLTFNAVLDPQKLRLALEGLVQRPGWERLGGRLRKNVSFEGFFFFFPLNFFFLLFPFTLLFLHSSLCFLVFS